jgi:tubulin-specific chaperone C
MSLESFLAYFYKEYNEINDQLTSLVKIENTENEQEEKLKLSSIYESVSNRTEILQKYFTDNTPFIPQYEIRKAQEHLTKLKRLSQEKREEIFPKKKFGFKSKQKITTLETTIQTTSDQNEKQSILTEIEKNSIGTNDKDSTCSIRNIDGMNIIKHGNEINSIDIGIIDVKNSCIQLLGYPSVLHATNIENSTILCGPVSGSAFFNNLKNVKLIICCHQLRIHESYNSDFYVHLGSRAIIENCSNVRFAPYSWSYPELTNHFIKSGHNPDQSNWTCIDDFNFLKINEKSPNWRFLDETERLSWQTNEQNQLVLKS